MTTLQIDRRTLIKAAWALGVAAVVPGTAQAEDVLLAAPDWDRTLILLELDGGNDGLNTVIPASDPAYIAARPTLAIPPSQVLGVGEGLGLNPVLQPVMAAWNASDLAIVRGVGYANPNRSHFRGIDIWNSGSSADTVINDGWLRRVLAGTALAAGAPAHGVLLGRPTSNPLKGSGITTLAMSSPQDFVNKSATVADLPGGTGNPGLDHLLDVQHQVALAGAAIRTALTPAPTFTTVFPTRSNLGRQCQYVAQLLAAGLKLPVLKLSIGGFDNHANQRAKHDDLLAQVADSLAALRSALIEKNLWNRVLVMSYSEFGRRVNENGSSGTDHGTASPHILLGGAVKGGLYGTQPSLTTLDSRGDQIASTDYRTLYATAASFLGYDASAALGPGFAPLAVFD
ncbi:hypothetical protein LBMAG53_12570 [Planctomycetota bacterium]|nr:hypothetical protein LBMAG53_12570 [Planctomycetota bacterium]